MIYPGTDLKFKITASIPNFDIAEHGCSVEIVNRRGRVQKTIPKSAMFSDEQGNWYFNIENVRSGPIFVRFNAEIPDKDYNKQVRIVTDYQLLCWVGVSPYGCPNGSSSSSSSSDTHNVTYTQVWTVNLDGDTYLTDEQGNLILVNGQRVRFTNTAEPDRAVSLDMTGDEFKTLIEGRSDDSQINTVPEVLDVMQGLDEDTELTVMTNQDVDDMMGRVLGTGTSSE